MSEKKFEKGKKNLSINQDFRLKDISLLISYYVKNYKPFSYQSYIDNNGNPKKSPYALAIDIFNSLKCLYIVSDEASVERLVQIKDFICLEYAQRKKAENRPSEDKMAIAHIYSIYHSFLDLLNDAGVLLD